MLTFPVDATRAGPMPRPRRFSTMRARALAVVLLTMLPAFALLFFNAKGIAGFYLVLFAAGSNYCIHATPPLYPQLESVKW